MQLFFLSGGMIMEKHLLVAVSDQVNAMYGPRFLNHFFTNKNDIKLTLFYIAPKPLNNLKEKDNHDYMRQSKKLASKYEARGRKAIEVVKKDLIKHGFKQDQVNTKIHVREISKVMDIVTEAEKGHNDAVVLGRRGLSWPS